MWSKLSARSKQVIAWLITVAGLGAGVATAFELGDRFGNRYEEPVPLVYYGANDFRDFLDSRIGEVVKLKSELVMDVMPGWAENMLLNDICDDQPEFDSKLPKNVFVTGFPEFDEDYIEPDDYVYDEKNDTYVFPASAAEHVRCFDSIRVEFKDPEQIRFNHGGTGLMSLPLNGDFMVERRASSGPRAEYTLREQ